LDAFLRKHDVDVGKTFAVILFLGMVETLYEWFFDLLFRHAFSLNVGIIILYFLAKGMWQHKEVARKWTLGLCWLVVGIVCLVVIVTPFHGGPTLTIGNTEIKNPPFWQVLVTLGVTAPLLWIALAALTSKKAKEEFTAAPPARVSSESAGGPAATEP
jgi:hypothetical protein